MTSSIQCGLHCLFHTKYFSPAQIMECRYYQIQGGMFRMPCAQKLNALTGHWTNSYKYPSKQTFRYLQADGSWISGQGFSQGGVIYQEAQTGSFVPHPAYRLQHWPKSLTLDSLLTLKRYILVLVNICKYLLIFLSNSSWESVKISTQTTGRCSCLKVESRSKCLVHDLELLELMHALGPPLLNLFLSEECRWWNFAIRTSFRAALFFYLPQKKHCNPHI